MQMAVRITAITNFPLISGEIQQAADTTLNTIEIFCEIFE
jgi:hypothetical protein